MPMGNPSSSMPHGTLIAGRPVREGSEAVSYQMGPVLCFSSAIWAKTAGTLSRW